MAFDLGTAVFHMELAGVAVASGGINAFLGRLLQVKVAASAAGAAAGILAAPWISALGEVNNLAQQLFTSLRIPTISGLIGLSGEVEQVQTGMNLMIGDAEKAKKLFNDIRQFSAKTPLTFPQARDLAQQLLNAQIALDQIIPTARMLGDVAFPLKGAAGVKHLAFVYSQFKQQGRITNQDLGQLTNLTIPIYKTLADMLGVTTARIRQMATEGKINFGHIHQALVKLTEEGGKFHNQMEESSKTLPGRWSTFIDILETDVYTKLGDRLVKTFRLKPLLESAISAAETFSDEFGPILDELTADFDLLFSGAQVGLAGLGETLRSVGGRALEEFMQLVRELSTDMAQFLVLAGPSLTAIIKNLADMLPGLSSFVSGLFKTWLTGTLVLISALDVLLVTLDNIYTMVLITAEALSGNFAEAARLNREQALENEALSNRWKFLVDSIGDKIVTIHPAIAGKATPGQGGASPLLPEGGLGGIPQRQAAFVGLSQLAERMQLEALRNNQQNAMMASAAATASATEKLASAVDNGALRVRSDTTGVPAAKLGPVWG